METLEYILKDMETLEYILKEMETLEGMPIRGRKRGEREERGESEGDARQVKSHRTPEKDAPARSGAEVIYIRF